MRQNFTVAEVATQHGVAVVTVRRWIKDHGLKAHPNTPASTQLRIEPEDLAAWLEGRAAEAGVNA